MKILIIRNNLKVDIMDDMEKVREYFGRKTPLQIEYVTLDQKLSNLQVEFFKNGTDGRGGFLNYYGLKNIKDILRGLQIGKGYQAVIFCYDVSDTNFIPMPGSYLTSWSTFNGLYPETEWIELRTDKNDDTMGWIWKSMTHELIHAFCKALGRKGRPVIDEMDLTTDGRAYLHNDDPEHLEGNYARTLKNLAPYWKLFEEPVKPTVTALLHRLEDNGKQTIGSLIVYRKDNDKLFLAKTLELSYKDNQRNISAIPKGEYEMKMTYSPKFKKETFEILSVPNRSGIRIHSVNYSRDLQGCIGLGDKFTDVDKDGLLDIINSRATVEGLQAFLEGKPCKLIIL